VRIRVTVRALVALLVLMSPLLLAGAVAAAPVEQTLCVHDALASTRTEIDTDLTVAQFDPALGTLLDVAVTGPSIHLDTDAAFESIASSPVVFAERMDYLLSITSPGGLPSPTALSGSIQRVPSQTLAAFDGTLDFLGASAVTQPATALDDAAANVTSADGGVLSAFTGTGTMAFHVTSAISEVFTGGGGNVQGTINTYASAAVQVCYRYLPRVEVAPTVAAPPAPIPATLPVTGGPNAALTAAGVAAIVIGLVLTRRVRSAAPRLDA
jgi:hypothetical protein